MAPQTPLAEEIDQIHFLPQPSGIFDKLTNLVTGDDQNQNSVMQAPPLNSSNEMPPVAPPLQRNFGTTPLRNAHTQSTQSKQDNKPKKKFRFKKLFNKLIDMF